MYGSHEDVTCHNLTSHILTVYSSDLQNETYRRQKCDLSSPKLFVRIIYLSTVSQKLGENKSQHHLEITGLLKWSLKFRNLWFVCNFLLFLLTGLYVSFIVCWNFPFISKLNPTWQPLWSPQYWYWKCSRFSRFSRAIFWYIWFYIRHSMQLNI